MAAAGKRTLTGVGLGLRWEFLDELIERIEAGSFATPIAFWEVSPENYMRRGGYIPEALEYLAEHQSIVTHGLSMSIGGVDPFDDSYMTELSRFVQRFDSPWHSDHLCFCGVDGRALHDLLPLPLTEAAAKHSAARVTEARDRLERPMAIENISYYLKVGAMEETAFINQVLHEADCQLLLDVNNVYVNSLNHDFDPRAFIEALDLSRVVQIHIAGHEWREDDGLNIDTHGQDVIDPVFELLSWTIERTGPMAVLLERDNNVPPLDTLIAEVGRVQAAYDRGIVAYEASRP